MGGVVMSEYITDEAVEDARNISGLEIIRAIESVLRADS